MYTGKGGPNHKCEQRPGFGPKSIRTQPHSDTSNSDTFPEYGNHVLSSVFFSLQKCSTRSVPGTYPPSWGLWRSSGCALSSAECSRLLLEVTYSARMICQCFLTLASTEKSFLSGYCSKNHMPSHQPPPHIVHSNYMYMTTVV